MNLIKSFDELEKDYGGWDKFKEVNLPIWNKLAEFIGYKDALILNPRAPIYLLNKIPEGCIKNGKIVPEKSIEFGNFMRENEKTALTDWTPNFNYEQAMRCNDKLLKEGKYNKKEFDYSLSEKGSNGAEHIGMNIMEAKYFGSMYYKNLEAQGKNELEAICNACIEFNDNKINYKKKFSGVMMDDTDKHP